MLHRTSRLIRAVMITAPVTFPIYALTEPLDDLKVVMIRHGEKPVHGDNLSCQGENRARQLPNVLYNKFDIPDHTYIPSLSLGESTKHARMFQTVTPFAVRFNLKINSHFDKNEYAALADSIRRKKGTVLVVWEHHAIPEIAHALGVEDPPAWKGGDFDSIWVITYANGIASLNLEHEGLDPAPACSD